MKYGKYNLPVTILPLPWQGKKELFHALKVRVNLMQHTGNGQKD